MALKVKKFLEAVLKAAIAEVKMKNVSVFTFAFYHDHESDAISVCVDTEENSAKVVESMNSYNLRYFLKAISSGDLKHASLWKANVGRSLSLGDFVMVNVARTDIGDSVTDDRFYLLMLQALVAVQGEIAQLSRNPERMVLACSGPDEEVGYVWSPSA